jgi:hypothetical protein
MAVLAATLAWRLIQPAIPVRAARVAVVPTAVPEVTVALPCLLVALRGMVARAVRVVPAAMVGSITPKMWMARRAGVDRVVMAAVVDLAVPVAPRWRPVQ